MLNREALETELRNYWKKENMVAHCMKSSKYIDIDGLFVDACDAKPSIRSTMYYDDEYDAPSTAMESFINYNWRSAPEPLDTERNRFFLIKQYCGNGGDKLASVMACRRWEEPCTSGEIIRELTDSDIEAINAAIEEVRTDYRKRLESYYKKYAHKIGTYGYWANR